MSMPAKNERIRESLQENDMTNYKGIYFGGDNEQAYYEGGAHFRYKDLCSKLEKIVLSLTPDRRGKSMYEDYTYSSVKEVSSVERTKPETRKVLSECSKDTYSENKSTHISPGPGNRARGEKEVSRNVKRHNVSQEKQGSYCINSFQSKTNKVHNNNMTKQYIKKINPNFVVSNSKPKENKYGYVDVKKTMKARILEINEKDSFSQQKQAMNISTLKMQNNNNIYPISTNSKATTDSIPSRRFFTHHNGSMSKKSENSRMTIEKSFKQSMDSSTPSDLKSDTRRKNELLQSAAFKSRNVPKFDLFKSGNKDTKSLRNYSIENPRNVSSSFNKSTPPSIISKTVHKISQAKSKFAINSAHFSQFNKVSMPSKKTPSPMNNRLVSRQSNQNKEKIGLKGKYGMITKPRNTSLSTKDRKSESVNKSGNTKVFSTTFNATFNPASFKQK